MCIRDSLKSVGPRAVPVRVRVAAPLTALSSAGQSNGLLNRRSQVRILQGRPIQKETMRHETVEEYLARGGKISKQKEVFTITWRQAQDLVEKAMWHVYVPPQPEVVEEAE